MRRVIVAVALVLLAPALACSALTSRECGTGERAAVRSREYEPGASIVPCEQECRVHVGDVTECTTNLPPGEDGGAGEAGAASRATKVRVVYYCLAASADVRCAE